MPGGRPGRGGRRTGTVGKAYSNRSDLNGVKLPAASAPGQAYGAGKAQEDAQRAVPMGTPEVAGQQAWTPAQGRPEGMAAPGSLGDLFAESARPDEPVTNGAAMGPGAGPEAFGGGAARGSEDLVRLQRYLRPLEVMANRPGASSVLRDMVRAIKAQTPQVPGA